MFTDLVYAIFGVFEPKKQHEKPDIATGGEDIPELEIGEEAETEQSAKKIKNNDTITINNKAANSTSTKTSR